MIVKIIKSALLSYVIRRTLKEADVFICNKNNKEKFHYLCENCWHSIFVQLYPTDKCPFCSHKINNIVFEQLYSVEDTLHDDSYSQESVIDEFEGLDLLINKETNL